MHLPHDVAAAFASVLHGSRSVLPTAAACGIRVVVPPETLDAMRQVGCALDDDIISTMPVGRMTPMAGFGAVALRGGLYVEQPVAARLAGLLRALRPVLLTGRAYGVRVMVAAATLDAIRRAGLVLDADILTDVLIETRPGVPGPGRGSPGRGVGRLGPRAETVAPASAGVFALSDGKADADTAPAGFTGLGAASSPTASAVIRVVWRPEADGFGYAAPGADVDRDE